MPVIARTTRPPNAMDVGGGLEGKVVVDHESHVWNVKTTCKQIRRDQDPYCAPPESLDDPLPFPLRSLGMHDFGGNVQGFEQGVDPVGPLNGLCEDHDGWCHHAHGLDRSDFDGHGLALLLSHKQ